MVRIKKAEIDRFKSAKYSAQLYPELVGVMSPKSHGFSMMVRQLGLKRGGSTFCKLGIAVVEMYSQSVEMVKNAYTSFDPATKLAMTSPQFEEDREKIEEPT